MAKRTTSTIPRYKRRRQRSQAGRIIGFIVKLVLIFLIGSVLWVLTYRFINPPITATMLGDVLAGRGATRDWMPISQIDRDMVRAAIAGEDSKFCSHNGFDFQAIENAMQRNASGGRIRGGSTISQQTAKNAFLWQGGGYVRKGLEAWFTMLEEALWPKQRIMEVYLNLAETGIGTYGVNAGSLRYFDHDASAMTRSEAARIAAVLPLPKKRGALAPKGFTRRYGSIIEARIGQVVRDHLDACVYRWTSAPRDKASPPTARKRPVPGDEYESATPPPDPPPLAGGAADEAPALPIGDEAPLFDEAPAPLAQPDDAAQPAEPIGDAPPLASDSPPSE